MSTPNMLDNILTEILSVLNPLRNDVEIRMRTIEELRNVVNSIDSLKGATVEPFGSFLSQLFSRWGDLDISIELPNGSHILVPAKKHKQMLLGDVLRSLRKTGSFRRLQFVSHARVPILKLESKVGSISCDISINNLLGHMKSKFLLWISLIDRRFRDMVLLVKEWAKANCINNPRDRTLNSYSLSLLVVFHFQTCAPAILPPLKDLYPGNMADELTGVRADVERHIEEIAASNIARFRKERIANHSTISQLFISFLGKFLDISTRATEQGICTYTGQWENISMNTRWLPKTYAIFIEDPFEQPGNAARAVVHSQLTGIGEVFSNTYNHLVDPHQMRNTIISSLVRREVSHLLLGATSRANIRPYPWSNQYAPRGYHPSPASQRQFQNRRKANRPKNMTGHDGKQPPVGEGLSVNAQLLRERPRNQHQSAVREKTAPPVPQIARPARPNTVQPSRNSIVGSQMGLKASPAAQVQQVWRQKQFEK